MTYPKPVQIHFYHFTTLDTALNYERICKAGLAEFRTVSVTDSRQLELMVDKTCSSHVCVAVEVDGTVVTAGVPSGQECAARVNRYILCRTSQTGV